MQKWEYITIRQSSAPLIGGVFTIVPGGEKKKYSSNRNMEDIHELLNFYGNQGFELTVATTSATNAGIFTSTWVRKRSKPQICYFLYIL